MIITITILILGKFQVKIEVQKSQRKTNTMRHEPRTSNNGVTLHCYYTNHSIRCKQTIIN